ncbi:thiamine pyrophosphate-binding protein [Hahella sp. KA22]|uniref:thiamine pyrophosphate-binding protein n=1 Tax=Hahella sp. KA22 TaxID=1628392 RepID=UPI001F4D4FA2|nr:thiamine pyrophosphate-binding protein [Hahella sp. KA22]
MDLHMKHGGDLVAEVLLEQGVGALFTLCDGHISPILSGCRKAGMQVIDARHEASAVFAADAYARLTGIPGVAAVTAGPGVTNAVTALKNAQMAQSPLILLGGASATVLRGRGSLQDIDQTGLLETTVKQCFAVEKVRDIAPTLREAFRVACASVPGPIFVELPIDLLYPEQVVREWYGVKGGEQGKGSLSGKAVQWYLDFHAEQMFKGAQDSPQRNTLRAIRHTATDVSLDVIDAVKNKSLAAVAAPSLRKAKRPVVVIGGQALRHPEQADKLISAIEVLGAPVYLSGMARGLLGPDHPLQLKHHRKQALRQADWVLLAGAPCDFRLDYGSHISRKATLVSVNAQREDLFKNRLPTIPVWGDPAAFIVQLAESCGETMQWDADWLESLRERDRQREKDIRAQASTVGGRVNPLDLLLQIDATMDERSLIIADGGDFVASAAYTLRPRSPLSWLDPGVFGTLGVGGGFVLGAAAATQGAELWLIYGDGSCAYSLAEFDTFVRHNMGVIAVVGNDACWSQIARDQVEILQDDVGVMLRRTDYHKVAEGYGGVGFLLDKPADIAPVLQEAKVLARQGRPVLINAILDHSDFRKGSISV